MRETLVSLLAEPGSGSPLRLEITSSDHRGVREGRLVSKLSGRAFPIVRGIPRFVEGPGYADSFGLQWNRYRAVQLDSATATSYSQRRFAAETGWGANDLAGRWVLDAGCGAGRFAEVASCLGANLVALDFSSAVEAAAQTLEGQATVDVVQGDLLRPPFRAGVFDFAYSIGVIQHTPAPARALASVVQCVRGQGGEFCFTIYARRPWTILHGKYLIRPLTRRLPKAALLSAIETAMPMLFPLADRLFRLPVLGRVAQFMIPVATYVDRHDFSYDQRYLEAVLDTFDMLSPRYDSPMTVTEVEQVLRELGVKEWDFRSRVPINVVGQR